MPKMVIAHPVIDTQRWLKGKADRVALLGQYATEVTDHVAIDGSNNVAITLNVHDMVGLQALMASPPPDAVAQEESHGALLPQMVYIEK